MVVGLAAEDGEGHVGGVEEAEDDTCRAADGVLFVQGRQYP